MSGDQGNSEQSPRLRPKALAAKDKKGKKEKGGFPVNCKGWTDEYGNWNTGFQCPYMPGVETLEENYCCGTTYNRFCCPEPKPIEPTPTTSSDADVLPLIAGILGGVVFIVLCVILCFACPCCPGRKLVKRSRKPSNKDAKDGESGQAVCQHCHATMTMTSQGIPDTLACGCEIGGPPGNHHFAGGEPDLVLHLYENPYVDNNQKPASISSSSHHNRQSWTQLPESDPDGPVFTKCEQPPPYDRSLMSSSRHGSEISPRMSPMSEDTPMIPRLESPSKLCMKTFRPMGGGTTSLSPISGMLRTPRDVAMIDQSRRDSGVLFENEDQELHSHKNYNINELDEREEDTYHGAIVVPKFNFQSLSLVNKSGLNSGGLSNSRTSGLSGSRGRTRKSKSSIDNLELEHLDQLMESIKMQTDDLTHS